MIDWWFERERAEQPRLYWANTRDRWQLALHRYKPGPREHRTPVILCHGLTSNRWDLDGPGRFSLARYLFRSGYDTWVVELRGAGRSTRPSLWNGKRYDWTFEDYVQHDGPATIRTVLKKTGAEQVHWIGHSMGGMIAYALLMSPAGEKIASAVTLGSPTMSDVGHPLLDFGIPYRDLLNYLPSRLPLGTLMRLAAPWAPLLLRTFGDTIADLGWREGNASARLLRTLMLTAVDDIPTSLLREFARWYDTKNMSDRYHMFDFTEHLERITTPILVVAGSKDELTPARDLQRVYERISSPEKRFRVIGREQGFSNDYSHVDLVLGLKAPDEVYPLVHEWLEERRGAVRPHARPRLRALPRES